MTIPNLNSDPDGITFLVQKSLKELGYYTGEVDNIEGPLTRAAIEKYRDDIHKQDGHAGLASSFADPADVEAFRRCKRQGKSDFQCFKVGDNGVGAWNDDTTNPNEAMVAIPRDIVSARWGSEKNGRGKMVQIQCEGKTFRAKLADLMPLTSNIKNGAVIDLNPGAQRIIGKTAPFLVDVTWWWVDDLT